MTGERMMLIIDLDEHPEIKRVLESEHPASEEFIFYATELEAAPDEGWVPDCHDGNKNGCAGIIRTIFNAIENGEWTQPESFMGSACKQCPYRKKEALK